jgi:hypothetical protein
VNIDKWTIVQHSGFGYAGKETFRHATETRKLSNKTELKAVQKAGGLVFDSYAEAEDFSDRANYPIGYQGIVPNARGTFSVREIDGLAVYIPLLAYPEVSMVW